MRNTSAKFMSDTKPLAALVNISQATPSGRTLFKELHMVLDNERVAVIGRNGVGKSSLLRIIQGDLLPGTGKVIHGTAPYLVPQQLPSDSSECWEMLFTQFPAKRMADELAAAGLRDLHGIGKLDVLSYGEKRKLHLLAAKMSCPDLLLLDEPTEDLDETGLKWLIDWLSKWDNGLLVVSHDRVLLSRFHHFFIIAESGCRYFRGSFEDLSRYLEQQAENSEKRYMLNCQMLARKEAHRVKVLKRRRRKKNYGRISEIERCTPRQRLNKKRSLAQVSQGKALKTSRNRIDAFRKLVFTGRRAMDVNLPLELSVPEIDMSATQEVVTLKSVSIQYDRRFLFKDLDVSIGYERFAVVGPNGSGKTTLLGIMAGTIKPHTGKATVASPLGLIAQGGENWMTKESLLELLLTHSKSASLEDAAQILSAHKFPFALAAHPLRSLSPGERVRAALICLFRRTPEIHILVLDEPTYSLDFVGETSLRRALNVWPGALVVASHNREFLSSIRIDKQLTLDGRGRHSITQGTL